MIWVGNKIDYIPAQQYIYDAINPYIRKQNLVMVTAIKKKLATDSTLIPTVTTSHLIQVTE